MSGHASWLDPVFDIQQRKTTAEELAKRILEDKEKYKIEAIACTGMSGVPMSAIVSFLTDIPLIIVRKDGDNSHAGDGVEFPVNHDDGEHHYVIIDEFVRSGNTIERIQNKISGSSSHWKALALYLYRESDSSSSLHSKFKNLKRIYAFDIYMNSSRKKWVARKSR